LFAKKKLYLGGIKNKIVCTQKRKL